MQGTQGMQGNHNFNRSIIADSKVDQFYTTEGQSPPTQSSYLPVAVEGLVLIPLGFVLLLWGIAFGIHSGLWKTGCTNISPQLKNNTKIPCANCQYFKNNPYLKCAVQPEKVLNAIAAECPDYRPKETKISA